MTPSETTLEVDNLFYHCQVLAVVWVSLGFFEGGSLRPDAFRFVPRSDCVGFDTGLLDFLGVLKVPYGAFWVE